MKDTKKEDINKNLDQALEDTFPASDPVAMQSSFHPSSTEHLPETTEESLLIPKKTKSGVQDFAFITGVFLVSVAIISLIIPGPANNLPFLLVNESYGWFLGVYPMNLVNKIIFFGFGLGGLMSATSVRRSMVWSRLLFVVMGILAILGLFPETQTLLGLAPLFFTKIFLHGILSLLALYFALEKNSILKIWAKSKLTTSP